MRRHWQDGEATLHAPAAEVPLRIAASYRARTRGLLGVDGVAGALLLTPASSVHTVRMRFAIDVAYLDRRLRVLAVRTMPPGRVGRPRLRARHVLEAQAGAMASWGVVRGARLEVVGEGGREESGEDGGGLPPAGRPGP
ncbi:DUF192 domain-containing protein [Streptomyces sp. V4-01]|uniref:DUF192 domain-containing protein n=1 Tax=Actinacidiphila polyblastidii TaxID=3110430 RepID=A0ABU7PE41_9ACTN|nr:DUF192 domain-containing protein [Streptomyces sp. V4-01]